jgi:hypothetical protein
VTQPSLEIAFWVALLTFPLLQIVLSMLARADIDNLIRYLTKWGICFNLASIIPFLFAVIYAIALLVSAPSAWNTATAVVIGVTSILTIVALLEMQSLSASIALANSAEKAEKKPRRPRRKSA